MQEALRRIETYTNDVDESGFRSHTLIQDAVIRQVQIIGEAAARFSQDFRRGHHTWPWREMRSMRNILVHEYEGVDLRLVWNVVRRDLPDLKGKVLEALEEEDPRG